MKCAIIIANDIKQIMLSPENDAEKQALKMITPDDDISIEVKEGSFYDGRVPQSARGFTVAQCQGGYLRAFEQADAVMLVLRRKEPPKHK